MWRLQLVKGRLQPADLGMRLLAKSEDLKKGSTYQKGMNWMRKGEKKWPCKRSYGPPLEEEMRKDILAACCNTVTAQ